MTLTLHLKIKKIQIVQYNHSTRVLVTTYFFLTVIIIPRPPKKPNKKKQTKNNKLKKKLRIKLAQPADAPKPHIDENVEVNTDNLLQQSDKIFHV